MQQGQDATAAKCINGSSNTIYRDMLRHAALCVNKHLDLSYINDA